MADEPSKIGAKGPAKTGGGSSKTDSTKPPGKPSSGKVGDVTKAAAKVGVEVTGAVTATVSTFPENYFDFKALLLFNRDTKKKKDRSVDEAGAKKYKVKANAPLNYVKGLQQDLITLGYLTKGSDDGSYDGGTARAVKRFQRHAARLYRMPQPDVTAAEAFKGSSTGECDFATAKEIRKWLGKKWVLPIGRFKLVEVEIPGVKDGLLRSDAAEAWLAVIDTVHAAGGILTGPYGGTTRALDKKNSTTGGASGHSFHYCGRAVDINQGLAGGAGQRYFLVQEPNSDGDMFWRIFCKTEKQDGTQGTPFKKGDKTCWLPYNESEYKMPAGHYIDMTETITSLGTFERIKAQKGWDTHPEKKKRQKKLEWWHFQFTKDKQSTFLDEIELTGKSEKQAKAGGWKTDTDLDFKPG